MREALDIIESLWPDSLFYAVAKKPDTDIDDIVAAAKRPLSNHTFTITEARKQSTRLGWLIPRGVLVVDIDDMAAAKAVKQILNDTGKTTLTFQTPHGYHFVFAASFGVQVVKWFCGLGIKIDTRNAGKGYIIIPYNDPDRAVLEDASPQSLPIWLKPIKNLPTVDLMQLEKGTRNDVLFRHVIALKNVGNFTPEHIIETVELVNKYILAEPLSETELHNTVLRKEAVTSTAHKTEKVPLNTIANDLLEQLKVITLDDGIYYYNGKYYKRCSDDFIFRYIHSKYEELGSDQRSEVLKFIKLKTYVEKAERENLWSKIALANCIVDCKTNEVIDFSPDLYITRYIDVEYNPVIGRSDILAKFLNDATEGNEVKIQKIFEMIGYCLIDRNIFQKAFFLLGPAHTGKSMMLSIIQKLFGPENCSSLTIDDLETTFRTAELANKLCNLQDDISVNSVLDGAPLKVLVGELPMTVERKYETPMKLYNTAKFIFSCNEMPTFKDKTDGMYRRLEIIEFNHKIPKESADPLFFDRIQTDDYVWLLAQSFIAIHKALNARKMIELPESAKAVEEYKTQQNNVLAYVKEANAVDPREKVSNKKESYIGRGATEVYNEYYNYCIANNLRPVSHLRFIKNICDEFNLKQVATGNKCIFVDK